MCLRLFCTEDVQLGWDVVSVKAITYDSHNLSYTSKHSVTPHGQYEPVKSKFMAKQVRSVDFPKENPLL